ncbi:MAG: ABC transporter permease, partial [Rhizobacter sp.]|nr:ABC transporter permease [Chlorobiales bacterium]
GSGAARMFENIAVGSIITFAQRKWTVVGLFDAGKSGFDSEMWGDIAQVSQAFRRDGFSSFTARVPSESALAAFQAEIAKDNRLRVDVKSEKKFYADQSEGLATFIGVLGLMVSIIFSTGAVIGAMITMYAAVAGRTREIGTLQAIGYSRGDIVLAFILESSAIAIIGGLIGILLATLLSFLSFSTTNFDSFSETEFRFSLSPAIILNSMIFAWVMGLLGGVLPAIGASRLKVVDALRSE